MAQFICDDRSASRIIGWIRTKRSAFWEKVREERMLNLFRAAADRVPAYKDFLRKNKIDPKKIKNLKDFESVPPVSKKNYLRQYPREKLCWDGTLMRPMVFTATSGSTGEPFYFPRTREMDWQSSIIHEIFLRDGLRDTKGPTLILVCFGMGVWIGGLITYEAFNIAMNRGKYPVSILTPGINKPEILKALQLLSPSFAQTIIAGYPPFVKDILDEAEAAGIRLRERNIRTLFAAEAFTESFRDYIVSHAQVRDYHLDTLNVYGTADLGTMAYETPTTIFARRLITQKTKIFESIFPAVKKTPTLAQYNPLFVNFESKDGELLITGDNAIPLVRYAIGDNGGAMLFDDFIGRMKGNGINFIAAAKKEKLGSHLSELPLVFVYERKDFSTTLYGLQIYPEHVREALIDPSVRSALTGKFSMATKYDKDNNQYLELNLERSKRAKEAKYLSGRILKSIIGSLEKKNSEFRELHRFLGKRAWPKLVFWPSEDPKYFRPGVKQQWVVRNR